MINLTPEQEKEMKKIKKWGEEFNRKQREKTQLNKNKEEKQNG
jgi:hypothetical protein|tara:strand:+ start:1153 stop:1281 length:129 start_codon:yes stop_codon:yes gene_type:complete